jgi:hypothetical protein
MLKKTILLENKASLTTKNLQLVIKSEINLLEVESPYLTGK